MGDDKEKEEERLEKAVKGFRDLMSAIWNIPAEELKINLEELRRHSREK